MPAGQLAGVMRHLRKLTYPGENAKVGDAALLDQFIAHRDEDAFDLLVRRHGPMVLGVCRRILGNESDAEDAFQATFLVLVRKAASIIPRDQVASWLHGVAHKAAIKARAMNTKRRIKERAAAAAPSRDAADGTWDSLLETLDGELRALPERYRAPIVLCDLEGLSYREAAARLGCPQGTLSGRLTRARALLARRLAIRCPGTAFAVSSALLARASPALLPPALKACTVRAGAALAVGTALTEGAVSSKIVLLTEGVLKMLLLSRLKSLGVVLLVFATVVVAGSVRSSWWAAHAAGPAGRPVHQAEEKPAPRGSVWATNSPAEPREATFVFRSMEAGGKTVSLVVAGTSAPILRLPIKGDVRVLVGGRLAVIESLRPGSRVAIRMDATDRVVQEIRSLERPAAVTMVKRAEDLARLDAPSTAKVLRALKKPQPGAPARLEVYRDNIQVVAERLPGEEDPVRLFPLVGLAKLHHVHWKCTVYYTETVEYHYPFPARGKRPRVEVVYFDEDYLVPTK